MNDKTEKTEPAEDAGSVEVVALQRGHDGVKTREEGERFPVAKSRLKDGSTWFEEVGKAERPKPAEKTSKVPPGAGPMPK